MIAVTVYLTFCAFLILPHLGAPPIFGRMLIGLCASEFVAALGWSFSRDDCVQRVVGDPPTCHGINSMLASVAGTQIPVLAAGVFVVATAYAVFVARRW